MTVGQIILSVGLAAAALYTVWGYPRKYGALSGRSRLYRTAGMGVLVLLLTLCLLGGFVDFYAGGVTRQMGGVRALMWWTTCLLLGLSLPLIALLDALETYVTVRREKRAFLEQMIQEEIESVRARQAQKAADAAKMAANERNNDGNEGTIEQRVGGR